MSIKILQTPDILTDQDNIHSPCHCPNGKFLSIQEVSAHAGSFCPFPVQIIDNKTSLTGMLTNVDEKAKLLVWVVARTDTVIFFTSPNRKFLPVQEVSLFLYSCSGNAFVYIFLNFPLEKIYKSNQSTSRLRKFVFSTTLSANFCSIFSKSRDSSSNILNYSVRNLNYSICQSKD